MSKQNVVISDEKAEEFLNKAVSLTMKMPGIKVNRKNYLNKTLSKYYSAGVVKKAIETTPAKAGMPSEMADALADSAIRYHLIYVSAISFTIGLPGKAGYLAGTIPADLAQIYWHSFVLIQKLCYIYGWPDFFEKDVVDDESKRIMIIFIAAMSGVRSATVIIKKLSERIMAEIIKKLPRKALTKYAAYMITKRVANIIGIKMTKLIFAKVIGKAIPIVGGFVSAGISYKFFKKNAYRLKNHLRSLKLADADL